MWFILDKDYKTLGVIENDTPDGLPLLSDKRHETLEDGYITLEFSVPSKHPKASLLATEGYVVYTDLKGECELFRIKEIETKSPFDINKTIYCETAATTDLTGEIIRPVIFESKSLSYILIYLLANTGWELGETYFDALMDMTVDDYPTALEAIRTAIAQFGAEIEFRVIMKGRKFVKKVVNVYEKRGRRTGEVFEYDLNLQSVTVRESTNEIVTAMIAVGGEDANGNPITIANAQVTPDAPFVKVDDYIGDTDALEEYGRRDTPDAEPRHIYGVYTNTDAQNPVDLYNLTLAELKKYNKPQYTYEVDVSLLDDVYDIGDYVTVKDRRFNPPLYLDARVLEKEESQTTKSAGSLVLGEYTLLDVQPIAIIEKLQKTIKLKEALWDRAKAQADQAAKDAAEANAAIVCKIEGVQQFNNGQGTIVYRAATFRRGVEIDNDGTELYYLWTMYDITNTKIEGFERSGKTLTLAATDFNKRVDLDCTVFELEELSN